MFGSIFDDMKREFSYGNMVTRLVFVNVSVFVLVLFVWMGIKAFGGANGDAIYVSFIHSLSISSSLLHNLTHPWVIFTSMFLHEGFMHILFNMLFLYWFGRIVGDLLGDHRILPLYLLAGLAGGVVFFVTANLGIYGNQLRYALGASGAVMGIVVTAGVKAPEYPMRLLLFGEIKLKYIVIGLLILDMVMITYNENTGGHFAHLGGAAMGWLYVYLLHRGTDLADPINSMIDSIQNFFRRIARPDTRRPGPRKVYTNPSVKQKRKAGGSFTNSGGGHAVSDPSHQEQLDAILDKIKVNGYDSLTQEEKEFLFKASQK